MSLRTVQPRKPKTPRYASGRHAAPAGFVGPTIPITWATGDLLMIDYLYEAA